MSSEKNDHQGAPELPVLFSLAGGAACTIRLMTEDDAQALCEFLPQSHEETDFLNYFPGEFKKTIEEERKFIREHLAKDGSLPMVAEVGGTIVAAAGAWSQEFKRAAHHAELGITVRQAYWGMGLGRKLMELTLQWARWRGLRKIYLRVFADNVRAVKLYRSLGFTEEGRLKQDVLRRDGRFTDTLIMARYFI